MNLSVVPSLLSGEGIGVPDRRESAWADPKTWIGVCTVLLTLVLAVISYAAKELTLISSDIRTLVVSAAEQRRDLHAMDARVTALENFKDTQEKAYNFNFTTRLAGAEADIRALQSEKKGK